MREITPPLDGSHLIRNMLPYNAVQVYDRIPIWVSYLFMMLIGGTVLRRPHDTDCAHEHHDQRDGLDVSHGLLRG